MISKTENPPAAFDPDLERLADILMALQRCFMVRLSEELSRGQISFPQFFLMGHINSAGSLSMTEIAEKMSHTTAAATGLVDRLENLKYVQRSPSATDRRKVLVHITPKGKALVEHIRQDMIKNLGEVMQTLSREEGKMWLQIYEKIFAYCQSGQQKSS